jgi:hypothetical protein
MADGHRSEDALTRGGRAEAPLGQHTLSAAPRRQRQRLLLEGSCHGAAQKLHNSCQPPGAADKLGRRGRQQRLVGGRRVRDAEVLAQLRLHYHWSLQQRHFLVQACDESSCKVRDSSTSVKSAPPQSKDRCSIAAGSKAS